MESLDRLQFSGINHMAMVCSDMAKTVEFYEGVLGMPLVCALDLPDGGQHFFFDIGNETLLAFFWFPEVMDAEPGATAPAALPGQGDFTSAVGSANHIAFTVPAETFDEHVQLLRDRGIPCSEVMNHDSSKWQVSRKLHDGVWLRSVYFWDPDGVMLELAALLRPFRPEDAAHDPKNKAGDRVPLTAIRNRG
jgi:catechol 2,3-dioxygenase-like lactoylglutathione lyase family enzyme